MHRPGYVQGGQEAKRGYLLLGIYYRRIPGDTGTVSKNCLHERLGNGNVDKRVWNAQVPRRSFIHK